MMPYFFMYSRNGRKDMYLTGKKKRVKKANESTMNRICGKFSAVGNINMNLAGVPAFNWEMLMPGPMIEPNEEAIRIFCEFDDQNLTNEIDARSETDLGEKVKASSYDMVRANIEETLISKFGSLRAVYPSLVWYLFTGDNERKISHKQMFWRVFGEIATETLELNQIACRICPECGCSTPIWGAEHICRKNMPGYISCVDCGKVVARTGPKQCRCDNCQEEYRRIYAAMYMETRRGGRKRRKRGAA